MRICCSRLSSLSMKRGRSAAKFTSKGKILRFGDVPEVALDVFAQPIERDFLDLDRDRAGLDLRQVENIVDEVEQVGAGRIDVAGKLDLPVGKVARNVLSELLAENEDRIERRPQLMRHVGEEFGFVFGGKRQFDGLFFQRVASLLDFRVLAFDLGVLIGEQLRLRTQFLVGLLQFALARLQLGRELLRLRKQAFGAHRRFDGVEDRAEAQGKLIQEGEVDLAERLQRRQFDDGFGLPLEQDRQARRC